jgi:hypothetical protein
MRVLVMSDLYVVDDNIHDDKKGLPNLYSAKWWLCVHGQRF